MYNLYINPANKKGHINPELQGHFSEHLGRCIYEGLYVGENSDIPNVNGMRRDVVEALKEMQIPVLRWPGGCFADEYHWKDGIGPKEKRKKMINTHWGGVVEDNSFGTHEFMELVEQLGKKIDIYVSGVGRGGTLQGVAQYLLEKNPDCKIVAVEPLHVSALLGDEPGLHQIQGIGDGFIPDILDTSIITDIIEVSDDDAINTARELAKIQGLLVGTSSGANVWAAKQMAEKYGKDKIIATVLADRAERYFSTALI